jgi:hypothetical protein
MLFHSSSVNQLSPIFIPTGVEETISSTLGI